MLPDLRSEWAIERDSGATGLKVFESITVRDIAEKAWQPTTQRIIKCLERSRSESSDGRRVAEPVSSTRGTWRAVKGIMNEWTR
ncbi:hypothetical protein ACWCW7_36060 [Nocardia tengchongensis]